MTIKQKEYVLLAVWDRIEGICELLSEADKPDPALQEELSELQAVEKELSGPQEITTPVARWGE
jgi:hypothetical protein